MTFNSDSTVAWDGDYSSAELHGALVPFRDNIRRVTLWRGTYQQLRNNWRPMPIGARGPGADFTSINGILVRTNRGASGSVLVEETEPQDIGAGILQWDRLFAEIPQSRVEFEDWVHSYQTIEDGSLGEIALPVKSRVVVDYFHTTRPERIESLYAYKVLSIAGALYSTGTAVSPGATEMLGENSMLERWRGNIYERRARYVPVLEFSAIV